MRQRCDVMNTVAARMNHHWSAVGINKEPSQRFAQDQTLRDVREISKEEDNCFIHTLCKRMALLRLSLAAAVLYLAATLHSAHPAAIPGFQECELFGRRYAIGATFHPILDVNGMEYEAICYDCVCLPSTIAQCEEIHCPPTNCLTPIAVNGECCPICLEPDISPDGSNTCFYDGVEYSDGDEFHPPSMMEAQRMNNSSSANAFCVKCTCQEGSVSCEDISSACPPLACNDSDAHVIEGTCCKMCPAGPLPSPQPGCSDNIDGRFHPEGSFWNPFYPGFGLVECINCTCNNSQVLCEREPCQPVPVCGPNDPVEDLVICCPKCQRVAPTLTPPTTALPNNSTTTTEPENEEEEEEEEEEDSGEQQQGPEMDLTPNLIPCDAVNTYRIYKHRIYDSMALVNTETERAEVFSWTLISGQVMRGYEESSSLIFYARQDFHSVFIFIGYTIPRRVNGLTTKESKRRRIEECMVNCSQMVVNMLRPQLSITNCDNNDEEIESLE